MKNNNKKIIVWNVTSKCNLNCEFCFGPEKRIEDLNTEMAMKTIDQFEMQGFEKIVFTGGEPLTRKDLIELVQYAKELGFYTILHTNGILLTEEKLKMLAEFLDQINLPIDGCDEETNKIMREKGLFIKIGRILEWLKDYPNLKIVISTVMTKVNKDCIIKIQKILPDYIFKWRVFQFKPIGKAELYKAKYEISDAEFDKIKTEIKKNKTKFEIQFVGRTDEFYESYLLK